MFEKMKQYRLGLAILALVLMAGGLILNKLATQKLASNLVQGSGRMDGDLINLNVKYAGRISQIMIQEGQKIAKGDVIALLKSDEYDAQKAQIEAQIMARLNELQAKELELEIAHKTIPETLSKATSNLSIKEHQKKELASSIASQKSVVEQDKRDSERMQNLYDQHLIEKRQVELASLKLKTSNDALSALMQKEAQIHLAIHVAKSEVIEAREHQKNIQILTKGVEALRATLKALEASKTQIEAILSEMTLRSPIDGVVVEKIANHGEVVGAGSVIATLLDPNTLYLKIFVDTKQNGNLSVGNDAVIFLDAKPNEPIASKVIRIEQRAEFTPKEVSVPSDRIQRVFALHIKPQNTPMTLKLGLPAVGVVSMDGQGLPKSLKNVPE